MKSLVFAIGAIAFCTAAMAQVPPVTVQKPVTQAQSKPEPRKLDLNGDGFVSREESKGHPGLDRGFGRIDTNKDGRLSQDELKVFRERREARREEQHRSGDDSQRRKDGDKHGDKHGKHEKKAKDRDGDGEQGRRGERGFAGLDADKDGFLTRNEIKGRPELQKRFHEIDSNNDNRLSREELRAARRKP